MKVSLTVGLKNIVCAICKKAVTQKVLDFKGPACTCGENRFDFDISSIKRSYNGPGEGEAAMRLVAGAMVGGLAGAQLMGSAKGESCTENRNYSFTDVPGEVVLDLLNAEPQQVIEWISARRKELAKANLRPEQGLCVVCGEVYTRALGGPQGSGFCSRICKDRLDTARGTTPATELKIPVQKVTCPKCTRPVKIKLMSGVSSYKCMWCGGAIELSSEAQ